MKLLKPFLDNFEGILGLCNGASRLISTGFLQQYLLINDRDSNREGCFLQKTKDNIKQFQLTLIIY